MAREDLAGLEGDDGDLVLVDDGEDALPGMGGPDPQMMQAARSAQGHPAAAIDQVVAKPEVTGGTPPGRVCLRSRPVGLGRGDPADGPVGPLLVVGEPEGIELRLQLG